MCDPYHTCLHVTLSEKTNGYVSHIGTKTFLPYGCADALTRHSMDCAVQMQICASVEFDTSTAVRRKSREG